MHFFIKFKTSKESPMKSANNFAKAIKKIANQIESDLYYIKPGNRYRVYILDDNGYVVGEWGLK